ncbi:hypothetical protein BZG35_11180 [Brevundimonas sp. LM2]|uniref:hypothetical protein n=1 Tax=Brevundimonas sp. LM2 TaxID=1938605 RepID=UPI000983D6BE|nr:hypothetical protein [Brevundimonas sp. LM2]AQR62142.1 hypothetical protein BZG35_11180 [Brevundimonas sp. LM2]
MVENTLVNEDIDAAGRLVSFLDDHGLKVRGALWLYDSDAERWRFVIAFHEARKDVTSFYLDVAKATSKSQNGGLLDLSRVDIVDPDRSIFTALRGIIAVDGNSRVRFSNNRINGVYLEDALIYRLSA